MPTSGATRSGESYLGVHARPPDLPPRNLHPLTTARPVFPTTSPFAWGDASYSKVMGLPEWVVGIGGMPTGEGVLG